MPKLEINKIIRKLRCFLGFHYFSVNYFDFSSGIKGGQCEYCLRIKKETAKQ